MPRPATRIPEVAVAGEDMRLRPYMKRKAAANPIAPITSCEIVVSITVGQAFFAWWALA